MSLIEGGSKQNWYERFHSKTYWCSYVLIALFTVLHVFRSYQAHDGQTWKHLLIGSVLMAIFIWLRPRQ